uniref:Cytochrome b561 bacterial/Ni-hydrogenase domain-containing protein n=1 Tax=Corethron hystrix TaxID=216773 RepID=A0A7S1FUH1_9STRA|mmetsp:Transcript_32061/g.73763  ORF Transcript_32061/g.73763 Transcript_32061/m.73763 type:complete len:185 (+) Transcript_32061:70-624(+)
MSTYKRETGNGKRQTTNDQNSAQYFHWLVAAPLIGSIGCVLKAQESPKEEKGLWMHRHKSLGLLTAMVVAPRAAYRLWTFSRNSLPKLSGSSNMEHLAGTAGHIGLYGFMTVMPATGIAMGYYGGKGLPFFGTTFAGAVRTEENKAAHGGIAKQVSIFLKIIDDIQKPDFLLLETMRERCYVNY